MAKVIITEQHLKDIADAIRAKTGGTGLLLPSEMASEIGNITVPTGAYGWLGEGAEYVGKIYEWNSTLDDTNYPSWTPTTSTGTILAAQSNVASYTATDVNDYNYYALGRFLCDVSFISGATLKTTVLKSMCVGISALNFYPSNYTQFTSENYTAYTNTALTSIQPLVYYNSSGALAFVTSGAYAPAYMTTSTSVSIQSSGSSHLFNIGRPVIYARCSNTYFSTARAAEVDTSNTKLTYRLDLFKVPHSGMRRKLFHLAFDIYNDESWDF